ncbi:hypothetical protein HDU99_007476, partial [Rhizoclosmatium hyalinum]
GKGRKRTSAEPVSTRQAQNRENQRKLREKKAAYISDLERRIAELEASSQIPVLQARINSLEAEVTLLRSRQNQLDQHTNMPIATSSTSTSVCLQCSTERLKTSICMDQIRVLEDQLRAANASSTILTTSASPASTIRFPTSYELFGPMEIDSTILALKQLPSLHGSSIVNDFCTLLTEHTQISDSKTARRHLLRMARTCTDLFDACTLIDRMKAVEVFSLFQQRNASHVKYFDQFILSTEPRYRHPKPAGFMDPPRTKALKEAMHEIPSLFLHRDTIDEFCELAMDGKEMRELIDRAERANS